MFSTQKRCLIGIPIWGYQNFYSLPPKKWILGPKTAKFGPKLAFLVNLGRAMQAYLVPFWWVGWWLWRAGRISQDTYLLYQIFVIFLVYYISWCITFDYLLSTASASQPAPWTDLFPSAWLSFSGALFFRCRCSLFQVLAQISIKRSFSESQYISITLNEIDLFLHPEKRWEFCFASLLVLAMSKPSSRLATNNLDIQLEMIAYSLS